MIQISKIDDLTFTVRFDPQIAPELADIAGHGSVEDALTHILAEALIRAECYGCFDYKSESEVPF